MSETLIVGSLAFVFLMLAFLYLMINGRGGGPF